MWAVGIYVINAGYRCLSYIVGGLFVVCCIIVGAKEVQCHFLNAVDFVIGVKCVIIVVHVIVCEHNDFFIFFLCFFPLC